MPTLPLVLAVLSYLVSVTLGNNGCNDAMLKMRIKSDFSGFFEEAYPGTTVPNYTVIHYCRAHSFTNPIWLSSTIIALTFGFWNQTDYTLLHYNSCDEDTSLFNDPIVLIPIKKSNESDDMLHIANNADVDFCHNCTNNATMDYCESCNSSCKNESQNELGLCHGPSSMQCCRYIEDYNCVDECVDGSSANEVSMCILENLCNNMNQCNNSGICNTSTSEPYFTCNCTLGFSGDRCQYNKYCNDTADPCNNEGMCSVLDADNFTCSCSAGYTGETCEIAPPTDPAASIGAIAGGIGAVFIIIAIIIITVVMLCVLYFYTKSKKGKVEISKKTSKVYPTNGDATVSEKQPMLDAETQPMLDAETQPMLDAEKQ